MIDLHSHILPSIDDGARDLQISLAMARASAESGVTIVACTPHIFPGVWNNSGPKIRELTAQLQERIDEEEIGIRLVTGADVHLAPRLVEKIRAGEVLTLNDSRYVLIELPNHVLPPNVEGALFELHSAGFVPILTHPERMPWLAKHYDLVCKMAEAGTLMQITAGSLVGAFGKQPAYWARKMLCEGFAHILASDMHNVTRRPQLLAKGWEVCSEAVGELEAYNLVVGRPYGILRNDSPSTLPSPLAISYEENGVERCRSGSGSISAFEAAPVPGRFSWAMPRWLRRRVQHTT